MASCSLDNVTAIIFFGIFSGMATDILGSGASIPTWNIYVKVFIEIIIALSTGNNYISFFYQNL